MKGGVTARLPRHICHQWRGEPAATRGHKCRAEALRYKRSHTRPVSAGHYPWRGLRRLEKRLSAGRKEEIGRVASREEPESKMTPHPVALCDHPPPGEGYNVLKNGFQQAGVRSQGRKDPSRGNAVPMLPSFILHTSYFKRSCRRTAFSRRKCRSQESGVKGIPWLRR